MSTRGRSTSPHPLNDGDIEMENGNGDEKFINAKVIIITNLTRNVVEAHLRTIFGFYGDIIKIDLPIFGKSGQNRGKAALEYADSASAHKAASHMDGGQLDGAMLKVELSELPAKNYLSLSVTLSLSATQTRT
ncbi:RNA-binding protein with serine-rich domain 1 [Grifola frondosa]|uniref:RNA-binding protein with serine-rich domain 1 n=1 Tax=Grifola frondosa TaxID=5627 RepID=A0A1C7LZP6_GRIFR|nr:RNA-binding protein with serine-rich domain 1 [Grifola frondosa]